MKEFLGFLFSKAGMTIVAVLLEIAWLVFMTYNLSSYYWLVSSILHLLSIIIVLLILNDNRRSSSKVSWIILIMLFPVLGGLVYAFVFFNVKTSSYLKKITDSTKRVSKIYASNNSLLNEIEDKEVKTQMNYLVNYAKFPIYKNSNFTYYKSGEDGYPSIKESLKKAKKYIFLEYFIINENDTMWKEIHEILKEKVNNGVEVRLIYDAVGSISCTSAYFHKKLEKEGIKCLKFNPIIPFITLAINNRDHRKMIVVDGKVAYSGGINIADEYINTKKRFGYWKDNVFKIEGTSVESYILMFLEIWNALKEKDNNLSKFIEEEKELDSKGYIIPFSDSPLDKEYVGKSVYLNMINNSKEYLYITSPYLIIDTDVIESLTLASKRGVDVRIITPAIPDKKLVFLLTRSYYHELIKGGVKIYEYTPGFIHSKMMVSDNKIATIGSFNLDSRSLYLSFECGTLLYNVDSIKDIKKDIDEIIKVSREIKHKETNRNILTRLCTSILRLFAPLL